MTWWSRVYNQLAIKLPRFSRPGGGGGGVHPGPPRHVLRKEACLVIFWNDFFLRCLVLAIHSLWEVDFGSC